MRLTLMFPMFLLAACGTGSTTDTSGGSDTSGGDTSGGDTGPNGYGDGACVSGEKWTGGNRESEDMNPGQACIECHSSSDEAPSFAIAGTVYTNYDEPKNCNGLDGATVRVTDASGNTYEDKTNSVGNFYISSRDARIKTPYTAEVEFADGTVATMAGEQTSGDCNSCHTQDGAEGAPGRISNFAGQ